MLKPNSTVLFQGDSITDAGRSREDDSLLGGGYPAAVAELLAEKYPSLGVRVLNRGISGNRSKDLVGRWREDCLDLKPDLVSILIGVNDTWRRYDSNDPTSDADFERNLETVVRLSLDAGQRVVLLNPFLLDVNGRLEMLEDLRGKQAAVKKTAEKYSLTLVDLDAFFAERCKREAPTSFSDDGVHPNRNGHEQIAREWLRTIFGE